MRDGRPPSACPHPAPCALPLPAHTQATTTEAPTEGGVVASVLAGTPRVVDNHSLTLLEYTKLPDAEVEVHAWGPRGAAVRCKAQNAWEGAWCTTPHRRLASTTPAPPVPLCAPAWPQAIKADVVTELEEQWKGA